MGLMSEIGPIDPQIGRYPALGLGYAIETLALLCKKYPESSDMSAKYLSLSLNLQDLGYFERVSESAVQYAERLLKNKKLPNGQTPASVVLRPSKSRPISGVLFPHNRYQFIGAHSHQNDTSL